MRIRLSLYLVLFVGAVRCGNLNAAATDSGESNRANYSIEGLNQLGSVATLPAFSDTIFGVDSGLRRALFNHGLAFRINALPRVSVNLLDGPVPAPQQAYIGQRPTVITGLHPIITADLRQLGLRNAQLHVSAAWRWTTWNPAGPKTISLLTLYLYKMWGKDRVELKAGYLTNDLEFVGMQVGGSLATGVQGVYAVLPYQVGMSYFPLTAPTLNIRLRTAERTYVKIGVQRSLDAGGGAVAQARNQTGFRFIPHGNKLLLINEAGYQRPSSAADNQLWIRAGYIRNSTLYTNKITGAKEAGNFCGYFLADYQLRKPNPHRPSQGVFIGGSAMATPAKFNAYDRYYEARVYQRAPLASRPDDVVSIVATWRSHSKYVTEALAAQGKTVWRSSVSLTGSYSIHVSAGNYLSLGLGYVRGPAITPRLADALAFTANWGLYF